MSILRHNIDDFLLAAVDFAPVAELVGNIIYSLLFAIALWGAYCCIAIWRRVGQLRFDSEEEQDAFLDEVQHLLAQGKEDEIAELCEDDVRAVPMLTLLALKNRSFSQPKLRTFLVERFQRDILADLDFRTTWVQTVIKAAPMLGLLGTVVGMMGAFSKLSAASEVSPDKLAGDIMLALITTACGLAIAIPLVLAMATLSNKIGRLEDLVGAGLARIVEKIL